MFKASKLDSQAVEKLLFTDETRFCLFMHDAKIQIWHSVENLVILLPPGFTTIRYVNEVFRPHVIQMHQRMGISFKTLR